LLGGSSDIGKALEYVRTHLIHNISTGARTEAQKVIFLFTSGRNGENSLDPTKPALKLKENGVKIFVFSLTGRSRLRYYGYRNRFGYWQRYSLLRKIASGSRYLLSARSYTSFYRVKLLLHLGK
jgi:hypothetical protein